jgi:transposase
MGMTRQFKTVDYEATLNLTVSLREALPPNHLARLVADVIAQLDLSSLYARYGTRGGEPFAPEILLGLLFYGYATGVFSSRRIEKATYEALPCRFLAGDLHPDHDTIAQFRKTFLPELKDLFVQVLWLAHAAGVLKVGNISLDGTKIHADAAKSHAVSYKRLLELAHQLRAEVDEWFALSEQADQVNLPAGLVLADEIARRQERLANWAQAKAMLEARAHERYQAERAAYEAKLHAREEHARQHRRQPRGPTPKPPQPGPRDKEQYNFTDPESRLMKNSTNDGFDQHYNAQVATDQDSLLMVAHALANHANDQAEVAPTLDTLPEALGTPPAGALDTGYVSAANIAALELRGIAPYIAVGRQPHHQHGSASGAPPPAPPPDDANPLVKMADKLRTEIGQAIYRLRTCTVEPVIGIIKAVLGFRQFSLRGLAAAAGEWGLVCLAFNLKRLHVLCADGTMLQLA